MVCSSNFPCKRDTRKGNWLIRPTHPALEQLDKLVGIAMLVAASFVFLYYTFWTLFMV